MFSYYGGKNKIVKHYPRPLYDTIVEPFAGAAWYSIYHKSKNIILNDNNSVIYGIWDWVINSATEKELLDNKDLYLGQDIRELDINTHHKNLLGFLINRGSTSPKNIVQRWSYQSKKNLLWASTPSSNIKRIAAELKNIGHWQVHNNDYKELPDIDATWFIDPPYQHGGELYPTNNVDYKELSDWCKTRKGQVIVCENSKADWLPFVPLVNLTGQRKKTMECIWTNM